MIRRWCGDPVVHDVFYIEFNPARGKRGGNGCSGAGCAKVSSIGAPVSPGNSLLPVCNIVRCYGHARVRPCTLGPGVGQRVDRERDTYTGDTGT